MLEANQAAAGTAPPRISFWGFLREGVRHRPGGAWAVLLQAGSVAAALYVLWIGALATITGNGALWLAGELKDFGV